MIVLFCVLVSVVALLDFILLMFTEIISALLGTFTKIRNRRNRLKAKYRRKRK